MSVVVYPLNDIDFSAEDVAIYNATRTSGIYADNDFSLSVTGADNTVSVDVGLGWMHLSKFNGVAVALKSKTAVDMGLPDSVYPRIDAVVLQFDANKNGAEVIAKKGSASSNPQPPDLSQTESLYELHLAHVFRDPSAVSITAADVSDMRLNPDYCGLMADAVSRVDTAAIDAQISALIQKLRAALAAVEGGTYYASKEYVDNKTIARAKLETDALYSPIKRIPALAYSISADDIGVTLANNINPSGAYVVTLDYSVAKQCPVGTEIAILRSEANSLSVAFTGGVQAGIEGNSDWKNNITMSIPERFGMIALKKIGSGGSYDYWLVTGNVEVV